MLIEERRLEQAPRDMATDGAQNKQEREEQSGRKDTASPSESCSCKVYSSVIVKAIL